MSEKLCGYRHLTDKRLENEKFKVSVKCLFYLLWIGHLTYRSDVYRSDGVTPNFSVCNKTKYEMVIAVKFWF